MTHDRRISRHRCVTVLSLSAKYEDGWPPFVTGRDVAGTTATTTSTGDNPAGLAPATAAAAVAPGSLTLGTRSP